jgi:acyl-Coa thioesterase superfamily protein/acyl-CoA thioesterase superfamily protein
VSDAFYERDGERFASGEGTRGPWDPGSQHAGPPAALLARALERCEPRPAAQVARVTVEILRPVPIAPLSASARVARPGRSVELLEGTLSGQDGTPLMRATAWRVRTTALDLPAETAAPDPPPPGPDHGRDEPFFPTGQATGYHTAMEYRFVRGAFREPGPAMVWMRMRGALVAGEEPTPLQRVMTAADSGNGVSAALDWREFVFVNTDLTVHLVRPAQGEWVGLESVTTPLASGVGLTDTALWDVDGRIGRAAQTLLVAAR